MDDFSTLDASLVQLLPQFEEGRARRLLDELPHDGLVPGELRLLVAAEITRPETSRRLNALHQLDHETHADGEFAAASRRELPPSTARTTRSRRSSE